MFGEVFEFVGLGLAVEAGGRFAREEGFHFIRRAGLVLLRGFKRKAAVRSRAKTMGRVIRVMTTRPDAALSIVIQKCDSRYFPCF